MNIPSTIYQQASFNVTVGYFEVGNVRNYLERAKFKGYNIHFIEEKESCWICPKTTFYIKGAAPHIKQILDDLNRYACEQWLRNATKKD